MTSANSATPWIRSAVHFNGPEGELGDVHPYFADGLWYLFYLKRTGDIFDSQLAVSHDKVNWDTVNLVTNPSRPPNQPYFALGIIRDENRYRSWYGDGDGSFIARGVDSEDLISWTGSDPEFDVPVTESEYPSGARDPFVFWDPDIARWRATMTSYRSRDESSMDVSIAISTSEGSRPTGWGVQSELIRFKNVKTPVTRALEPECTQMFKIGRRWYLLTSLARQTAHWVGGPTIYVGDEGTPINEVAWAAKAQPDLDGEDLCAAQIVQARGKTLLMGWIPIEPMGQKWGGNLALPREIYALSDGSLAVRLDPDVSPLISGAEIWPQSGSRQLPADAGEHDWRLTANCALHEGPSFGSVRVPVSSGALDLEFVLEMDASASAAGVLVNSATNGLTSIEVSIDRLRGDISVRRAGDSAAEPEQYSSCSVRPGDLAGPVSVRLVLDDDIVEIFVADRYSLAARVPAPVGTGDLCFFATHGRVSFADISVRALMGAITFSAYEKPIPG